MRMSLLLALFILVLFVGTADGQKIQNWSYDRLFDEADLIVIASAQKTDDSDDVSSEGPWKKHLVGQRTTFSVIKTLKGRHDHNTMTVLHFRLKKEVAINDGPLLVSFRTKGVTIQGSGVVKYQAALSKPEYLLFLKRNMRGLMVPVSGQTYAESSVKEIYKPLPAVMDEE